MSKRRTTGGAGALALIALFAGGIVLLARHHPLPVPASTAVTVTLCHANGPYPDRGCTPGERNPAVQQGTINQTICVVGWTATIRPPQAVTNPIKTERMAAYGIAPARRAAVELDHMLPLELGGAPLDIRNLWAQESEPVPGFHEKDLVENWLHARVCDGTMTLSAAQDAILTDWVKLWRQITGAPSSPTPSPTPVASVPVRPSPTAMPTPTAPATATLPAASATATASPTATLAVVVPKTGRP